MLSLSLSDIQVSKQNAFDFALFFWGGCVLVSSIQLCIDIAVQSTSILHFQQFQLYQLGTPPKDRFLFCWPLFFFSQMLNGAGLFTYIRVVLGVNVGKYTIHWASGFGSVIIKIEPSENRFENCHTVAALARARKSTRWPWNSPQKRCRPLPLCQAHSRRPHPLAIL